MGAPAPAQKHHFKVDLDGNALFSMQVTTCLVDTVTRTVSLVVEHPVAIADSQEILNLITRARERPGGVLFPLKVELLDGGGHVTGTLVDGLSYVIGHTVQLDYEDTDRVLHEIQLRFS